MSFTNAYSEALTFDGRNPKITDLSSFRRAMRQSELPATCFERAHGSFVGFRTWPSKIIEAQNVERFGWGYDHTHQWAYLCAELSKYTEPFYMDCSPNENRFPELPDYVPAGDEPFFFRAECADGKVTVTRFTFSLTSVKVEIKKRQEVAGNDEQD